MLLGSNLVQSFSSGSVGSHLRYDIGAQGALQQTTRVTDLAILGSGFFVVSDNNGAPYLTRAGAFVPDASGYLVNTAGYRLMGYDLSAGAASQRDGRPRSHQLESERADRQSFDRRAFRGEPSVRRDNHAVRQTALDQRGRRGLRGEVVSDRL